MMKDKKEILFNHYESDPDGGLLIDTESILAAMEEYATEKLTAFMLNYIGRGASRFEVEKMIKNLTNANPFNQMTMTAKFMLNELVVNLSRNDRDKTAVKKYLLEICDQLCREQRDLCDTAFMNSNWDEHMECSTNILNAPMPDLT